jgi:toxin ParE1/3/4
VKYKVLVTPQARTDIRGIHEFILQREGAQRAAGVLQDLKDAVFSLASTPLRGKEPAELEPLGATYYLQIVAKPYRILYYVQGQAVQVVLVADGRRDFASLLDLRLRKPIR